MESNSKGEMMFNPVCKQCGSLMHFDGQVRRSVGKFSEWSCANNHQRRYAYSKGVPWRFGVYSFNSLIAEAVTLEEAYVAADRPLLGMSIREFGTTNRFKVSKNKPSNDLSKMLTDHVSSRWLENNPRAYEEKR